MFSSSQQSGFISIFYSVGSNPLALWDKQVKNGHIRRVIDDEVKSLVLDIGGTNVATTYITCPIKPRAALGIKLPYLVMVIKNMKKYFSFEIQILGSVYLETVRVQIHANVRIRRIYFTDQLHSDDELPNEFKLFAPGPREQTKGKTKDKKSSKETMETAPPETLVPLMKLEQQPEEETPPPPSPAEESPIAKDKEVEAETAPPIEEVVPPEEGEAAAPEDQPTDQETLQISEGGEAPAETGEDGAPPLPEVEVPSVGPSPEEGLESVVEVGATGTDIELTSEADGVEPEDGTKPIVEEGTTEEGVEAEAVPAETTESEAPVESSVEPADVVETTEATVEGTTEVSDTEATQSEAPTTDQEGEAD
ncbi:chemotaxis regulatory protein ChePep isoform X2 [Dendroctonus ponderosae]|uniref:chemotaxis regulatory protein ChePep isoform X2 n=1 Tax=Dendroctonus ponderosae TaxID=77166 RepID=UPI002035F182|nr:chemotaxis regulatory protein ChePep isoform X2 [Dendroctonus ponderosae]